MPPTLDSCIFQCNKSGNLVLGGTSRIHKIIESSKIRQDSIHHDLQASLDNNPSLTVKFHSSCISTYTSKHHIERLKRRSHAKENEPPPKRRSSVPFFDFHQYCLICGEECLRKDPKNPGRWRPVTQCQDLEVKETLLQTCSQITDEKSQDVQRRILSAVSDLQAVGAQYHRDCYRAFTADRYTSPTLSNKDHVCQNLDVDLQRLYLAMQNDPSKVWTSIELCNMYYTKALNDRMQRSRLINRLQEQYRDEIVIMNIQGCASLICLRSNIPEQLKLVQADDNDPVTDVIQLISDELKLKEKDTSYALEKFNFEAAVADTSSTLLRLVSGLVSPRLTGRAALSLAQSIQAIMTKSFNQTTLGLAVKLHHQFGSRELIDTLHHSGYIASYDEVLRFRKSAAKATAQDNSIYAGLLKGNKLLSAWFDNFDLQVYTPNGCRECHCMAMEFVQNSDESTRGNEAQVLPRIPRVSKQEADSLCMTDLAPVQFHLFDGKAKPIPPKTVLHEGLPFNLVKKLNNSIEVAQKADVAWLVNVLRSTNDDNPQPEWSGYMSQSARNQLKECRTPTKLIFGPLINAPPAEPDTVLTTLLYIEQFMKQQGQTVLHVSADMQLFKVVMQVKWSNPTRWNNLIVRPGGMHTLMSFIGCIGTLMRSSGLEDILSAAFKGIPGMMNGKAWPKALRGLRMVVEALLEPFVNDSFITVEALHEALETSRLSRTGRLWVDCLIKPVTILLLYIRAEREGDWLLHLYCLRRMLPYFYAAGHWNYCRYIHWHIIDMQTALPQEVLKSFLDGEHVCRHRQGVWNAVYLDQYGEQTYIRSGKSKGGLIGKALSEEQVASWVLSHHLCNTLAFAFDMMYEDKEDAVQEQRHKEEGLNRKCADAKDRNAILVRVKEHQNPLKLPVSDHLVNIVSGKISSNHVNADNALAIGEGMMSEFDAQLPEGFYKPLRKKVHTMEENKTGVRLEHGQAYDVEKLFARMLVISQNTLLQHYISQVCFYNEWPKSPQTQCSIVNCS